jgi:hypothetical protein
MDSNVKREMVISAKISTGAEVDKTNATLYIELERENELGL